MSSAENAVKMLKESVVGQDEYVKQLAILGYKHVVNQELIRLGRKPINNNLLVAGPTGTGKTFGAKKLAEIINIPFYEVDCSNIVQTGYRGTSSVEHILKDVKDRLGSRAEHAIIYLDEFDKVYDKALEVEGKGKGAQQNFLKMLEPNTLTINRDGRHDEAVYFNTSGISFIASGSFNIVEKNNINKMGLTNKDKRTRVLSKKDIISAGYMEELIGRFGTLINLNTLDENDYYQILTKSKDSAYTQYQSFFGIMGIKLIVENKVLKQIAKNACSSSTGARGIFQSLNNYLDECVYAVACDESIDEINVCLVKDDVICKYHHDYKRLEKSHEDSNKEREVSNDK